MSGCGKKDVATNDEVVTLTWLLPGDQQPDMASVAEKINEIKNKLQQIVENE